MMKKLLFVLAFSFIGNGIVLAQKKMPPFMSKGNGIYETKWSKGTLGWPMKDKYIEEARNKMMAFGKEKNAEVEVTWNIFINMVCLSNIADCS